MPSDRLLRNVIFAFSWLSLSLRRPARRPRTDKHSNWHNLRDDFQKETRPLECGRTQPPPPRPVRPPVTSFPDGKATARIGPTAKSFPRAVEEVDAPLQWISRALSNSRSLQSKCWTRSNYHTCKDKSHKDGRKQQTVKRRSNAGDSRHENNNNKQIRVEGTRLNHLIRFGSVNGSCGPGGKCSP